MTLDLALIIDTEAATALYSFFFMPLSAALAAFKE
jgi:hypothetical protein